jgi:PPK2 family polyphosphate:nucleotide phosphotransferase
MKIDPEKFRVGEGEKVNLRKWATHVSPFCDSKEKYEEELQEHVEELRELQNLLYAHNRYALLVILQAMDAAGKDSAIKHVMSGVNPQGCQVFSFKHPSIEELEHDFLWRTTRALPERGRIGIFNRSYYEEVLILRVHSEILESEGLPDELIDKEKIWEERYRSILAFERHLDRNGTRILKFFLHISKDEQRKRFLKRLERPDKNWKFSMSDMGEREHWKEYMEAYEKCLNATSTRQAPWYVIPADNKQNARLLISRTIVETLKTLKMSFPKVTKQHRQELEAIRKILEKE